MSFKGASSKYNTQEYIDTFNSNLISPIQEGYSFSGEGDSAFYNDKKEVIDNLSVGIEKVSWIIGKIDNVEKREKLHSYIRNDLNTVMAYIGEAVRQANF